MKKYSLDITIEEDGTISSHEMANELTITELRMIISVLEEIKFGMVIALRERGKMIDLKKQPKQ